MSLALVATRVLNDAFAVPDPWFGRLWTATVLALDTPLLFVSINHALDGLYSTTNLYAWHPQFVTKILDSIPV